MGNDDSVTKTQTSGIGNRLVLVERKGKSRGKINGNQVILFEKSLFPI